MSTVTTFESRLHAAWQDLTTEARADLDQSFAELKAQLGQFKPLLQTFEADVKAALAADSPGVQSSVTTLVEKLLADAAKIGVVDLV